MTKRDFFLYQNIFTHAQNWGLGGYLKNSYWNPHEVIPHIKGPDTKKTKGAVSRSLSQSYPQR